MSFKQSVGNNCEDDQSELFFTLQRLISQGLLEDEVVTLPQFTQIPANLSTPLKLTDLVFALQTLAKNVTLTPCFHDDNMERHIFSYLLKIQAYNYCAQINRISRGLDMRHIPAHASKMFISARKIYQASIRRRCILGILKSFQLGGPKRIGK